MASRSMSLREGKGVSRREVAKAHVPDGPETVSDATLRTPSYNDSATPVNAAHNPRRLQHASRPLPTKPTSKAKMADRSSTSGSDTMKTAKDGVKLSKRASRDEFYDSSRAYRGPLTSSRTKLPTPDTSPKTTAPVHRFASRSGARELAIDPMMKVRNWDIGMALGSPSHPPVFSDTWNPRDADLLGNEPHLIVSPPASRSSSVDSFDMPVSKKVTGKWKLFNIFTRKPSDLSAQAVPISDLNGLHDTNRPEEDVKAATGDQPLPLGSKSLARTNTTSSRKVPRHRPIVARSQTVPMSGIVDGQDQLFRGSEPQGDGSLHRLQISRDTGPKNDAIAGPLLDVEIPDVRLERYSVMFNSVLNSNPPSSSSRQESMHKLSGIEDAVEREEGEENAKGATRRVTSPQPATRNSGLALFPANAQGQKSMPQKLSPRLRSNTSPALFPATFHSIAPSHHRESIEDSPGSNRRREKPGILITTPDPMDQETPPLPRAFSSQGGEANLLVSDSPTETEPVIHKAIARQVRKPPLRHISPEPRWRIIDHSQKTLPSSATTKTIRPMEISVARQISISRQQPVRAGVVVTSISASASPSPSRRPSAGMPGAEKGRIAKTKTSTPTLVHPPDMLDPRLAQLPQHRRSERVVLEDA